VPHAAPNGVLFFEGNERIFPAFLTKLIGDYKIQDNKFNLAGVSNGGSSAFLIASKYPQYFVSVVGFPGFLDAGSPQQVAALSKLCIHMYADELDSGGLLRSLALAAVYSQPRGHFRHRPAAHGRGDENPLSHATRYRVGKQKYGMWGRSTPWSVRLGSAERVHLRPIFGFPGEGRTDCNHTGKREL
jgi:poly(3-hydroxybutyrate) depolymerase